ncbi:hypothetical protein AB0K34_23200 [Actinomadura sp. NPDC049382]|uniref:hypothetical protein n=1 Tax=Actinomadura sp. NPDC049382 TaxID=3158220 RepID=UPI00343A5662
MTALAVAMDVVAAGFLACFVYLLTQAGAARGNEGGRPVAMVLISISLCLLSVPLWALP